MKYVDLPLDFKYLVRNKKRIKRQLALKSDLIEKRIAIISGSTIGELKDIIELILLYNGILPSFYVGSYNRFYEEIMFDNAEIIQFKPDYIYIHTTARNYSDNIYNKLYCVWEKINLDIPCIIIQNNFELPLYEYLNNTYETHTLNLRLLEFADKHSNFFVNDINRISALWGLESWYNEQNWHLYKYAVNLMAIPKVAEGVAKIIKSTIGKNKKCLILDLDNTIWGGVVGEVGRHGIEIGMNSAVGEAYLDFQQYVKKLHDIGIILAVCSKNDEKTAKSAFSNPCMILRIEDFSAFYANWDNKSDNIVKIAQELNISTSSMVFVDDNPVERDLVRSCLPEVAIPEVHSVLDFITAIDRAGYFEVNRISSDDMKRNEYYASNAKRLESERSFTDYGEYLKNLNMVCEIKPFCTEDMERITQLINKTNQFNLTTKRYTVSEINGITEDSSFVTLYANLDDKFGSNGIVSALIGEIADNEMHIRLWVMSCRVFKRNLELAVFDYVVETCIKRGIEKIIGYYYKTEKNGFVSNLLAELGFSKATEEKWSFSITDDYCSKNKYMQVKGIDG